MNFPFNLLAVVLSLSALAGRAATSDDMLIYSDRFNNGWGDGWSWMTPRYATNNPVYAGTNSMALVPNAPFLGWVLKPYTTVDATIYTNLTFWLNGGATGGQN